MDTLSANKEKPVAHRPYVVRQTSAAFRRAGAWCCENPLKVYGLLVLAADVIFGTNPNGGWLWKGGIAVEMALIVNNIAFGKGGEKVDPSVFRFTGKDAWRSLKETFLQPAALKTKSYWREAACCFADERRQGLFKKAGRSLAFWRYPSDAFWLGSCFGAGMVTADVLIGGNLARWPEAAICAGWFGGVATGFLTGNNNIAGKMLSLASCATIITGLALQNPHFIGSGLVYIYANHVLGRSKTALQSNYTRKQLGLD